MYQRTRHTESNLARLIRRMLAVVLGLSALGALVLWRVDNPRLDRVRMSLADMAAPALEWSAEPMRFASSLMADFGKIDDLYEQNRNLRREIQRLKAWRVAAQQLEQENARLRALNNVQLAPRIAFVSGDVIADSGGPFMQTALVNLGSDDNVEDGAAVVDGAGLIGRVVGVGDHASRILLLTDINSRVPVVVRPGGARAILTGDHSARPRLEFLLSTENVSPGDRVVTTGDGGVFPPELPVGRIAAVGKSTAVVELSADYDRLEFVRILRYRPPSEIDHPSGLIPPRTGGIETGDWQLNLEAPL